MKKALTTISLVLLIDQCLKIWIKLNFEHGDHLALVDNFIFLRFIENPGMAFGLDFGGQIGKIALSVIRLIAVVIIGKYLFGLIKKKVHSGYIICVSLVLAGALGNILDSALYGLFFDRGLAWDPVLNRWTNDYNGLAELHSGYAPFLMGHVVDMIHVQFYYPDWFPFGLSGKEVFPPIFNIADAAITTGVISIIVFQKKFFPKKEEEKIKSSEEVDQTN